MIHQVNIEGMTCGNCVQHVKKALLALPGVTTVEVDLASQSATLQGSAQPSREQIASALDAAGYALKT